MHGPKSLGIVAAFAVSCCTAILNKYPLGISLEATHISAAESSKQHRLFVVAQLRSNSSYGAVHLEAIRDRQEPKQFNAAKQIFVEALIAIKAEAERALAREMDCSVISVPEYFGETARDAITAATIDVGFHGSEVIYIMPATEAIRLAYDFGTCSGRRLPANCDLSEQFTTLIVDLTPISLSLTAVSMGKETATILNRADLINGNGDGIDFDVIANNDQLQPAHRHRLEEALQTLLAEITSNSRSTLESHATLSIKAIKAVVVVGHASHESHEPLSDILIKLLEPSLGVNEDWFFRVIDPSQVVSIGAARQAKALVDLSALEDSTGQQQTFGKHHEEL